MDTYTMFSHSADHMVVHVILWVSLIFSTGLVFYWAAVSKNDSVNNPEN